MTRTDFLRPLLVGLQILEGTVGQVSPESALDIEQVGGVQGWGVETCLEGFEPAETAFHRLARNRLLAPVLFRGLGFPLGTLDRVQGDRRSISGDVARAYRWPFRRLVDRAAPLGLARMVPDTAAHPSVTGLREMETWLRTFPGPIELVWGRRDPLLGRALERHVQALPRARVTETEAGHFLQEEVPEIIARSIRRLAGMQEAP